MEVFPDRKSETEEKRSGLLPCDNAGNDSRPKSEGLLKNRLLHIAIAISLATLLLYFSLRGIQWSQVWGIIVHTDLRYLCLTVAIGTGASAVRALRWQVLLQHGGPVTFSTAYFATVAGYFGNNYLPARAGEVIRVLMVSGKSGLSKMFVATTALSERVSDGLALILISSFVLLTIPSRPGWFAHAARPFAVIGICGALCIAVMPRLEKFVHKIVFEFPGLPPALRARLEAVISHVLTALRAFHDVRRLVTFVAFTGVIWFSDAVGVVVLMHALHLQMNLAVAFLLITGLGLGSALPSTPGYLGIYQFVAVSVLVPFGFSKSDAIAYILLAQALQYFGTAVWGLIAFGWARDMDLSSATRH